MLDLRLVSHHLDGLLLVPSKKGYDRQASTYVKTNDNIYYCNVAPVNHFVNKVAIYIVPGSQMQYFIIGKPCIYFCKDCRKEKITRLFLISGGALLLLCLCVVFLAPHIYILPSGIY